MTEVYLLSVHEPIENLALAAAALSSNDKDIIFVDTETPDVEIEALKLLSKRLDVSYIDAAMSSDFSDALSAGGVENVTRLNSFQTITDYLTETFGPVRGWCLADSEDLSDCLKAAAAAVRLGFYFLPMKPGTALPSGLDETSLPLCFFGSEQKFEELTGSKQRDSLIIIKNYRDLLKCFEQAGLTSDYLVLYNSADLVQGNAGGDCLGKLWVKGLSLLLSNLAAYRNVFPFDAAALTPDPAMIEADINDMVAELGLKPRYLAVLASPAVIPFFYEEKKMITAWAEEMIRDIHVRVNDDLFFDLAEGRLMQHSPAGLSVQLISTRRYTEIQSFNGSDGRKVLIVGTPYVDTGIIFASDQSLMKSQLFPMLESSGYHLNVFEQKGAHYKKAAKGLTNADFLLYTGHGGPEGLHTHGKTLNRDDLPQLPPLVAYTSACSTVALVPHWYSDTEGLKWDGVAVDSRQVIGLSFVEKGALCFIGGATIEDLQYSTSIYAIFTEAVLIKGLSVGEALLATKNFISLFASTLMQKNPDAYRCYRWGTANAIHQQVLLGDPAFTPIASAETDLKLPACHETLSREKLKITVEIPEERWRFSSAEVNEKEASKHYYRSRRIDVESPYGEDVISWGDYYRVAPNAENISETAVMSSFVHLFSDLPPGMSPKQVKLVDSEAAGARCLLCDKEAAPPEDLTAAILKFKIPYLLKPPIEIDMSESWAFSVEDRGSFSRLHWLVPLLLIDDHLSKATRIKKLVFEIDLLPSKGLTGKVENASAERSYLVGAGFAATESGDKKKKSMLFSSAVYALTRPDGSFTLNCAEGAKLAVEQQFPLYGLLESYEGLAPGKELVSIEKTGLIKPVKAPMFSLNGRLLDRASGEPISGGLVRVFRGEEDPVGDHLIEAYAGEAYAASDGSFSFNLTAGKYLLAAAAAPGGMRYKSSRWAVELKEGEDCFRIYPLDRAVIVKGIVTFDGNLPPDPPAVAIKRYPAVEGEGALSKLPVNRDGSYECLVSFQDRFRVVLEEEGWKSIEDDNGGQGYKLNSGEILERSYTLIPLGEV
jgi:hypothetical protein